MRDVRVGRDPAGRRAEWRRWLTVVLGGLWLLDGGLQLQPYMFRPGSDGFLGPISQNAMGGQTLYAHVEQQLVLLLHAHQTTLNALFAAGQLAIGAAVVLGALGRRPILTKVGLVASALWAVFVWVAGEAFGGMIYPQDSMLVGAPGAALLYAVLSLLLWPPPEAPPARPAGTAAARTLRRSVASEGPFGRVADLTWVALFDLTALLYVEIGNRAPDGLAAQVRDGVIGNPHWLVALDDAVARAIAGRGLALALGLAIVQVAIGQGVLRPATRRLALGAGVLLSLVFWVVGQDFGGIFTGTGTDPNLGPLVVVLALALWPLAERRPSADRRVLAGRRNSAESEGWLIADPLERETPVSLGASRGPAGEVAAGVLPTGGRAEFSRAVDGEPGGPAQRG